MERSLRRPPPRRLSSRRGRNRSMRTSSGLCLGKFARIARVPVWLERDHHVVEALLTVELAPAVGQ